MPIKKRKRKRLSNYEIYCKLCPTCRNEFNKDLPLKLSRIRNKGEIRKILKEMLKNCEKKKHKEQLRKYGKIIDF